MELERAVLWWVLVGTDDVLGTRVCAGKQAGRTRAVRRVPTTATAQGEFVVTCVPSMGQVRLTCGPVHCTTRAAWIRLSLCTWPQTQGVCRELEGRPQTHVSGVTASGQVVAHVQRVTL